MRSRAVAGLVPLALLALVLAGCGRSGPQEVTLADLAADAARYDGRQVVTWGEVVAFDEVDGALVRHVVVQDDHPNRVQLEPIEVAEPHVGAQVEVRGTFRFDPQVGRIIEVEAISAP